MMVHHGGNSDIYGDHVVGYGDHADHGVGVGDGDDDIDHGHGENMMVMATMAIEMVMVVAVGRLAHLEKFPKPREDISRK